MKIIRTKTKVTYGDRSKKNGIIALVIKNYTWQEKFNRYEIFVEDCEVKEVSVPNEGGPSKYYIPISTKTITKNKDEIDQLFTYFKQDILSTDSFTEKLRDLIVKGLLLDTQQNPVYDSVAEDWEIIDTDNETVPISPITPETNSTTDTTIPAV